VSSNLPTDTKVIVPPRIFDLYFGTTCPMPPLEDRLAQPELDNHLSTLLFSMI
jgi:hypothetical protein